MTLGLSYGTDKIKDFVGYLKDVVDDFHLDPQAYGPTIIESKETEEESYDEQKTED